MPIVSSEGKPRLFFSTNDPDELWRFKEKVVAVIESYFQNLDDLYVFSSARIPNVAGDSTEIDVAYSTVADPSESFEFVQVRDRSGTQGRPWVEQIIGQQSSLGIDGGIMVSTSEFSGQAIRLAISQKIRLRLLFSESVENIKLWYSSDCLGITNPISEIDHCSILVARDDKIYELIADRKKCIEKNILVPTDELDQYKIISLRRVFDVDIMRHSEREKELFGKLPKDDQFHNASLGIEYKEPRLFIRFDGKLADEIVVNNEILPVRGIVFFVRINRRYGNFPITYRFKYINVEDNRLLAQAIIAETHHGNERYYFCLVRYAIGATEMKIGGGFFR